MKNLLSAKQMHDADAFTIKNKEITSIDLMESAATAFVKAFIEEVPDHETSIAVLCGKGNNGGDGLAVARLLKDTGYSNVFVYVIAFSEKESEDYTANLKRLEDLWFPMLTLSKAEDLPDLKEGVIIDAVLGSGLNARLEGAYKLLAQKVNAMNQRVIAIDVPTGFPAEGELKSDNIYLKADLVICFERPKINFFFPESAQALKHFRVVSIGLDEEFIQECPSNYHLLEASDVKDLVKPRELFTHKGTYGHALIIAGQQQTMGAALLAARACLHAGAGLTTVSIPESGLTALNTSLPEVMYLDRSDLTARNTQKFNTIAIGPGFGTGKNSTEILKSIFLLSRPLILDADALNIIGNHPELLNHLPSDSILTPHMKEFDHLFGTHQSWWERLETARKKAVALNCVIILKNQFTFIIDQSGNVTVNSTGNPAMAQGGMGDVLTGLIASFTAQGYQSGDAAIIACYLHGKSGDELAEDQVNISASALANHVPYTLKGLIK
jgi:hydroxyethylthiazole kinase-like uncharacterized protein yjeF